MVLSGAMVQTPQADDERANKLAYYLLKDGNKANRPYRMLAGGDVDYNADEHTNADCGVDEHGYTHVRAGRLLLAAYCTQGGLAGRPEPLVRLRTRGGCRLFRPNRMSQAGFRCTP